MMRTVTRRSRPLMFAIAATFAVTTGVLAPSISRADQAMIDYREAVMDAIGGHTKALASLIKGTVPLPDQASVHARALGSLAQIVPTLFPEDSREGKTEALPAIWEKPEDFKKAVMAFQTAAEGLSQVADSSPREMAPAFGALAKTCKGCHDNFKKKD